MNSAQHKDIFENILKDDAGPYDFVDEAEFVIRRFGPRRVKKVAFHVTQARLFFGSEIEKLCRDKRYEVIFSKHTYPHHIWMLDHENVGILYCPFLDRDRVRGNSYAVPVCEDVEHQIQKIHSL